MADNWQIARQSSPKYLHISSSSGSVSTRKNLQKMETSRIRHEAMESCIPATRGFWAPRDVHGFPHASHQVGCLHLAELNLCRNGIISRPCQFILICNPLSAQSSSAWRDNSGVNLSVVTFAKNEIESFCSHRFGQSLRYLELPMELITHTVLHELASKCPNLTHVLLDFSTAMQLHDFNDMQVWRSLSFCKCNFRFAMFVTWFV